MLRRVQQTGKWESGITALLIVHRRLWKGQECFRVSLSEQRFYAAKELSYVVDVSGYGWMKALGPNGHPTF